MLKSREELIRKYFNEGYKYWEIRQFLKKNDIDIYIRQLKRILRKMGLSRKYIIEDLEEAVIVILEELQGSGNCLGYKSLWRRLRDSYKLKIKRDTVLHILHVVDPEGIEERSRYRLKRRLYSVAGSCFIWHLDGYDKLKPFGFCIHACIDGFSRKIIWLELSTTNKKPEMINYYYLSALRKYKIMP